MKKMIVMTLMVLMAAAAAFSSIGIKGIYFSPSDQNFKDIYGAGPMYGAQFTIKIMKNFDIWIAGNYFTKKGKLTYTQEDTTLTLIPIQGGLRFRILTGTIEPYVAGGVNYSLYMESNPIGDVNKGGLGFIGKAGVLIHLGKSFGIDVHAGYSSCKFTPADFEINVGGIEFGAGIFF